MQASAEPKVTVAQCHRLVHRFRRCHRLTSLPLNANPEGIVVISPVAFVLVRTLEHVSLSLESKLAARVEGGSKLARLGLTAQ